MIVLINDQLAYVSPLSDETLVKHLEYLKNWNGDFNALMALAGAGADMPPGKAILQGDAHARTTGEVVLVLVYDYDDHTYGLDYIVLDVTGGTEYREVWDVVEAKDVVDCIKADM